MSKDISNYALEFPEFHSGEFPQDREHFILTDKQTGQRRTIDLHEYGKIFSTPGLYESLYHNRLECSSPRNVCQLLDITLSKTGRKRDEFRVLDLAAGNGIVGEELVSIGIKEIYGLDIIPEAREAALRDRPHVYRDYYVADLTQIDEALYEDLTRKEFNCMTVVAALGFSDVPTSAFARCFDILTVHGWVAMNIKEQFLSDADSSGYALLINQLVDTGVLRIHSRELHRHRLSIGGVPINYSAIVAEKTGPVPEFFLSP